MPRTVKSRSMAGWLVASVAILILTSTASAEWKEEVLYSFQGIPDAILRAGETQLNELPGV